MLHVLDVIDEHEHKLFTSFLTWSAKKISNIDRGGGIDLFFISLRCMGVATCGRETELVNLGTTEEKKEVKVGTGMTALIRQGLITLLEEYQDVFAWSYQDMPGLDSDIVQHKLPLNPGSSPVKKKLR